MNEPGRAPSPRLVVQLLVVVVGIPFLPLLIAQDWRWWEAWAYGLTVSLGFVVSRALAARRHPDLLAERARGLSHEDAKPWDRVLAPLVGLGAGLVPLAAGLEARFGSSGHFPAAARWGALVVILAGFAVGTYALMANRFFSGMVRIQTDRGHHVVSSGPYRWVRHPGYAAGLPTYFASAVLLDSLWALGPATAIAAVLVVRTKLEDEALLAELDGYRAYAERTRYRLLPGVW